MNRITFLIKSFLRDTRTENCVASIEKFYPESKIFIIDDGYKTERNEKFYKEVEEKGHKVLWLPEFDMGISVGRNRALENIKTEYTLVGDNDFVYTKDSGVERMLEVLEARPDIDIVCGGIFENGKHWHYEGFVDIETDKDGKRWFKYTNLSENAEYEQVGRNFITKIDLGFNYFLMRTKAYPGIKWDEDIKVSFEHTSGMYRAKLNGIKMFYLKDAYVNNDTSQEGNHPDYLKFRRRKGDFVTFSKLWDVDYAIDFHGSRFDFDATS